MKISYFNTIFNDAPQPWQLGFQDSAAPGFSGIVELHNTIFFYLVLISVGVFWVLGSIVYYYSSKRSPIVHKYLNHGTLKCLHVKNLPFYRKYFAKNNNVELAFSNKRYSSSKASVIEESSSAEFKIFRVLFKLQNIMMTPIAQIVIF